MDINHLARGEYGGNVKAVLEHCNEMRSVHRSHRQGFTNDRARTGRMIGEIPLDVIFDPRFSTYFDDAHDMHERKKHLKEFLQKYPQFLVVDKL